ncbi:major facilitator superfamily domain-containing protein [Dactylonectria macrodidyma]|uniref:Major facilitator superfamily domain-containing protein n=1 Tax=Dactylonectria macrodidyma TaxID=307937 RepID=A0A9P9ESF5_9HYPO|nr:major facilitator superfamily domain-containing protein [Dactylonectria macrodidyma]
MEESAGVDAPTLSKSKSIALVSTVTGAAFINTLASQSVVIILPTIGHELDIPDSRQQWIVTSYLISFGCFLLIWGRIADIYGKRAIFIWGSLWVTVVSAVNPFIPNEIGFNVLRGLHGFGAAANVPTAIGILGATFSSPGRVKTYAFSAYASGAPLGNICGTLVAGVIAQYTNWKWVFIVQAILAGLITLAGIYCIPQTPCAATVDDTEGLFNRVDWIGGMLITVAIFTLLFSLAEGNIVGWKTPWISVLIVVSLLIVAAFVAWQWYIERKGARPPLVKISLFSNGSFSVAMVAMCFSYASFNNFLVFATYFFQEYQDLSPLQTMYRFIPSALAAASLLFAVPIPTDTNYFAWTFWAMMLCVASMNIVWPCFTLFASNTMPKEDQAMAGALMYVANQLGRAFGLAISTTVQLAVTANALGTSTQDVGAIRAGDLAYLKGIRAASWLDVAFALAAMIMIVPAFWNIERVDKA